MLGLGSVFLTPYRTLIERLAAEGRAELVAAYDIDPGKREAVGRAPVPTSRWPAPRS